MMSIPREAPPLRLRDGNLEKPPKTKHDKDKQQIRL